MYLSLNMDGTVEIYVWFFDFCDMENSRQTTMNLRDMADDFGIIT